MRSTALFALAMALFAPVSALATPKSPYDAMTVQLEPMGPRTPSHVLRVGSDWGGGLRGFARAVQRLHKGNVLVVVDGKCASACTMLMALPASHLCFAPDARLGFHGVREMLFGTKVADPARQRRHDALMGDTYPEPIRARYMDDWRHINWLQKHHWETGVDLVAMAPDHLRLCSSDELAEARGQALQRVHGTPSKR
jgi:hypothetical protein